MKLTELKGLIESGELNVGEEMEREEMDLVKSWMDDGDWEYYRLGVVEYKERLWLVDVENMEEEYGWFGKVKEGMGVEEVEKKGKECGVLVDVDWGYGGDNKVRYKMENGEGDVMEFVKVVCD